MTDANPSSVTVVPIGEITPRSALDTWQMRRMKIVLARQGQIEPLQINRATNTPYLQDPWSDAILYAAIDLGWDTILVFYTDRYMVS